MLLSGSREEQRKLCGSQEVLGKAAAVAGIGDRQPSMTLHIIISGEKGVQELVRQWSPPENKQKQDSMTCSKKMN